jgi:DNA-binding transcriptional MerR regulator
MEVLQMEWTIPGTVLTGQRENPEATVEQLRAMFLAGGIVRSQVAAITGLEPHAIQNWVKRGFLSPPQHRQYTERQFARVVIINLLRQSMQIDKITALLSSINGKLSDERDDRIDDPTLYNMFINLLCAIGEGYPSREAIKSAAQKELCGFPERYAGDKKRIERVLSVMVYAYLCSVAQKRIDQLLCHFD